LRRWSPTGIALSSHAGVPLGVPVLLGVAGFLITAHPPPFGPTGLALFIAAVLLLVRRGSPAARPYQRYSPALPKYAWAL
jgi:hypothetical protein